MIFPHNRQGAFTLIEVMVAMVVFTMVIAGGLVGISRGFELIDTTRNYTRSSQVLQSELELLRTLPWSTFSQLTDIELTEKFQEQIIAQFGEGSYDGTVATELTGGDLMQVVVTVEWSARKGRVHTLNYVTFFTDGGVNDYFLN
ncbi:MAG: prepilin-type N-terminal cleavage/methylation domain-containing protein [Opitutae bacterium]|jgi:prepilin-type N-terminal cleavage/methylation domain-containing protein|nr:prepilin-type N-terminal cleavage/methylation domain-containing protein [Opitutae bacterium]MDG1301557.1 prepilin-type N-terminal cleavage/methylation domain-containing protein [Opitutae bacterium]